MGTSNLLTIFLKIFLPSTRMLWGVRASNVDLSRYDWLFSLIFKLECLFSRFADLIVVNSYAGQTYHLAHGFPADKMVVIPNGIDTERFKPDKEARARVRAEWNIAEDTILIGLVGRLDPLKDHSTFLKAAALLCQEWENIHFVCVGSGLESYANELYRLSEELGISNKVIWAGARADMPAVHNSLDIAASSSYTEGFPNVIGEAMACGVPCVVTDVGDSALIVGDTGVVVPPKDPEAIAAGLKQVIREKLCNSDSTPDIRLRMRIVTSFNCTKLIENYSAVLSGNCTKIGA